MFSKLVSSNTCKYIIEWLSEMNWHPIKWNRDFKAFAAREWQLNCKFYIQKIIDTWYLFSLFFFCEGSFETEITNILYILTWKILPYFFTLFKLFIINVEFIVNYALFVNLIFHNLKIQTNPSTKLIKSNHILSIPHKYSNSQQSWDGREKKNLWKK